MGLDLKLPASGYKLITKDGRRLRKLLEAGMFMKDNLKPQLRTFSVGDRWVMIFEYRDTLTHGQDRDHQCSNCWSIQQARIIVGVPFPEKQRLVYPFFSALAQP